MTKRLDEDALELVCLNFRDSFIDFLKHFLGRRNVPDESAGDGVLFIAQRSEEKFLILAGTLRQRIACGWYLRNIVNGLKVVLIDNIGQVPTNILEVGA